ncbi:hypothetical protein KJ644_00195 [Candidatus Dependentiae bacterium]|nr:hypothetical protein [Candidatus Dependentiae bacterium]MBU4386879.1 hypothetical protein [Candidatus Dependentiae bacterium]MCG2756488.1 hypothetical protein [Candidatus Dependentiae bacterium]
MAFKKLTFIIYDGISNSVFTSQVLKPLLNLLQEDNNIEINLISFEKTRPTNKFLLKLIPAHDRLHFILCRRLPFVGKFTLNFAIFQLIKLFTIIEHGNIIARGPLAGLVAQQTLNKIYKNRNHNTILTIQARGLCAEEYRYTYQDLKENFIIKKYRKYIYKKLLKIEQQAYKQQIKNKFIKKIESVSPALKEYLATTFKASRSKIEIAQKDLPQKINFEQIKIWRQEVRKQLNISENQTVYCYSGSYKPWQCIPEIIEYFLEQYKINQNSFLLLLSPDKQDLIYLLKTKNIPDKNYIIINSNYSDLYKYMAASDIGLLFRDKDIINWVSRPTKMLEYQTIGLKIVHNNTIELLDNQN